MKKLQSPLVSMFTRKTTRWTKCIYSICVILIWQKIQVSEAMFKFLIVFSRWGLKIWRLGERETLMLPQRFVTMKLTVLLRWSQWVICINFTVSYISIIRYFKWLLLFIWLKCEKRKETLWSSIRYLFVLLFFV